MMNWIIYYSTIIFILSLISWMFFTLCLKRPGIISPGQLNIYLRWLFGGLFLIPAFLYFFPQEEMRVFSSGVLHGDINSTLSSSRLIDSPLLQVSADNSLINWDYIKFTFLLLMAMAFLGKIYLYVRDLFGMRALLKKTFIFKRYKNIEIHIAADFKVPFAYWTPRGYIVVLPEFLLGNKASFNIALAHELQHHRQGDTKWIHLISIMKVLFFWNPFFYIFEKYTNEIQELACDESLIGQRKASFQEYTSCLLEVAKQSVETQRLPVGTAGMALSRSGKQLKQRIIIMKWYCEKNLSKKTLLLPVLFFSIVTTMVFASQNLVGHIKVTKVTANELVQKALRESDFPIEINDKVLKNLNYYVGTSKGKEFIRKALKRKDKYQKIFSKKLKEYNMPEELLAVALMESGFNNSSPRVTNSMKAAGVWQFIPGTARNYGLKNIGEVDDERFDVRKETDAAMRLLGALNLRFRDWRLAIMAYNAGGRKIQKGIRDLGSRNPWELIEKGYIGDKGYLSKVMAGILILKNPSLLN